MNDGSGGTVSDEGTVVQNSSITQDNTDYSGGLNVSAVTGAKRYANVGGSAVTATGCTLTFRTPHFGEYQRPSLHSNSSLAINAAPDGSAVFVGGDFSVYGGSGAADVPIRGKGGVGSVEL